VTIRRGGSPRAGRDPGGQDQAHPVQFDWSESRPAPGERRRWRGRSSGGSGLAGFFRFLLFTLVLAGIVLIALVTVLRPLISGAVVGWAGDNPSALGIPFVADMVRDDLGPALTTAASDDPAQVDFVVQQGDTARSIADRLAEKGFLKDARAFVFIAIQRNLEDKLEAGTFILRKNMTPNELVTSLLEAHDLAIELGFREGLRLEQITAKLATLPVKMDVQEFYQLVKHPTSAILEAHPWLHLPKGASLEGFLAPATYTVMPDITPEELVNRMLDTFYEQVGAERMNVPKARGMTFYEIVTLASLVERESKLDSERPLIAGVFQNRLNPRLFPLGKFQSDATVFYVNDTVQLSKLDVPSWTSYTFWAPLKGALPDPLPADLAGYDTYAHKGLMPGPICSSSITSIDAALNPNTKTGYLYFVAKNDGSDSSAFARTSAEHQANVKKYGHQ
jgi:UPF0755 protein